MHLHPNLKELQSQQAQNDIYTSHGLDDISIRQLYQHKEGPTRSPRASNSFTDYIQPRLPCDMTSGVAVGQPGQISLQLGNSLPKQAGQ
jgi:hypothetical protein